MSGTVGIFGLGKLGTALARLAVAWAGTSDYASDVLFGPRVGAALDALLIAPGLQPDPLVLSLAEQEPDIKAVELTVSASSTAALALYRRCGFEQSGLEDSAIRVGDDYYDRVHMRRLTTPEE